jgi:dTDP-glucose pyrophosphorylase
MFKSIVEPRLKNKIEIDYVYQHLSSFAEGRSVNPERVKPWGTAHAILCCKGKVKEPFAVINADDFYGKDSFRKAFDFLQTSCNEKTYAVIAYQLTNTLSEHGSVSRGVLSENDHHEMTGITERLKIYKKDDNIVYEDANGITALPDETKVSMNFFCYAPQFIDLCEKQFQKFLDENAQSLKAEFLIPNMTDYFIKSGSGKVQVIPTSAKWFGVTYKEDAPVVEATVKHLVEKGEYPESLWATHTKIEIL